MSSKNFKILICFSILITGIAIFLMSPIFSVSEITITGNKKFTEAEIWELLEFSEDVNIFAFSSSKAKKQLLKNHYIDSVKINKNLFDKKITIVIDERILSGYVRYTDETYLYIDEYGRVLDVSSTMNEKLPVIVGLDSIDFSIGNILQVKNRRSFYSIVTLSGLFIKHDLKTDVIKVDVSKNDDIHIYTDNLDISLGDITDASQKIRIIKAIMEELGDQKGFLDVKNISKPPLFKILT